MTLWLLFGLMTAAAMFAVVWPLGRRVMRHADNDVAVYRDQLDEIARDRAAGLIGEAEAEAARVEVSRRLLAAADAEQTRSGAAPGPGGTWRRRAAAVVVLVGIPALAAGFYLRLGSPDLPGQPLASRAVTPLQNRSLDALLAQVEQHLEKNHTDGRGWEVVAPVYLRLGRFEEAVRARRNALRLNGASAEREADLGEALMSEANGIVTDDAKAAFDRALKLDAKFAKARFFLGVAAHQDGQAAQAIAMWRDMLKDLPQGSPWIGMVHETLAQAEGTEPPAAPEPGNEAQAPGPSREDVAAAEQMKPEDRSAMIRSMVERLAERLKHDGSDVEGWLRLVRAYTVLGDHERALSAVADARRALGQDVDSLRRLDELVKELRLES